MNFKTSLLVHIVAIFLLLVLLKVSAANQPCLAGYTGSNCSINIDDCANVKCSGNGNCSDRVDGYFCFCFTGFYGVNCELDADQCVPNPCQNNGTCTKQGSLFKCNCITAYEGTKCETKKVPIKFSVTLTLRDRQYDSDYADLTKPKTRAVITDLSDIFAPFFKATFSDFQSITFRGFSSGSLVTNFDIAFEPTSTVSDTSITQALKRANGTKDLGYEILDKITVGSGTDHVTTTAAPTESSKLPKWALVLIIAGVIMFILLVILIFLVLYKRSKADNPDDFVHDDNDQNSRNKKGKIKVNELIMVDGVWEYKTQAAVREHTRDTKDYDDFFRI